MIRFLNLLWVALTMVRVQAQDDDVVRLWSSTGGGWKAMFACMGYANAFEQAGLSEIKNLNSPLL
jgi:hypothetical protein